MSDITANVAPIGGGKSLWGTIIGVHELEKTERLIVTDIPIILENAPTGAPGTWLTWQEWAQIFIKAPCVVSDRVAWLNEEQAREFWRYLPIGFFIKSLGIDRLQEVIKELNIEIVESSGPHATCRLLKLPNIPHALFKSVPDFLFRTKYPECRIGCHYIIDEAHKKFPPMHYQKVGAQAEWYMSELRKLNDDLDWITQHPEKVDKNFRRNLTQSIYVENMSKTRLTFGVSLPGRFRWHWYNDCELPQRATKPTASGWYYLDRKRRYHYLYKTMDGTGVAGGMLMEKTYKRGRHWSIYLVILAAIIGMAFVGPKLLEAGMSWIAGTVLRGAQNGISKGVTNKIMPTNQAPTGAAQSSTVENQFRVPARSSWSVARPSGNIASATASDPSTLVCTGIAVWETNVEVVLSDGRVAHSDQNEVQGWGKRFVKVFGLPPIPIQSRPPGSVYYKPAVPWNEPR